MEFTPKQIVKELDKYIIGQEDAKKQVAIALRNRYRRAKLPADIRAEITPKNIILKGPTGVGKTEIARRLAKIISAPFIKVEATKFTEVGYVGKDVESIIKDLVTNSVNLVKNEMSKKNLEKAKKEILKYIAKEFYNQYKDNDEYKNLDNIKEVIASKLLSGELNDKEIEVELPKREKQSPILSMVGSDDLMGINISDILPIGKKKNNVYKKKIKVSEAIEILTENKSLELLDEEEMIKEAIDRAENHGIIFIDEIDKIAMKTRGENSPSVSREGVQRDILPIVEGSVVNTKYGPVKTDYMLFIAAGAFHEAEITDLIPELQGRFPVISELNALTEEDFVNILKTSKTALLKQYELLLSVDNVKLIFTDESIKKIAKISYIENEEKDNIGARRLHAIIEKILFDISYNAGDLDSEIEVKIDEKYIENMLKDEASGKDLSKYIL